MSTSDPQTDAARVRLVVTAAEQACELEVIDSSMLVAERGAGRLTVELPPGVYKVRARTGGVVHESYAVLRPGAPPVAVSFPRIELASPAPLDASRKAHAFHMEAARKHSRQVHVDLGGDSEVFVYIRSDERDRTPGHTEDLGAGTWLADADGARRIDLGRAAARGVGEERGAWCACNVRLPAGTYRFVVEMADDRFAQTVVASPGWQTQLFLVRRSVDGEDEPRLDLPATAVFLVRRGRGFDPREHDLRLIELARHGLVSGRPVLSRSDMQTLLTGKFETPMLGLFAAHLLLLSSALDRDLLETIVHNLRRMLGQHPDVEAIARAIGLPDAQETLRCPPILVRSWWLVLAASAAQPRLVPPGSPAARAATRLWGPGPWLVWSEAARTRVSFAAPNLLTDRQLYERLRALDLRALADSGAELSNVERALIDLLAPPRRSWRVPAGTGRATAGTFDAEQLTRALGVPPAALREVLDELYDKAPRAPADPGGDRPG